MFSLFKDKRAAQGETRVHPDAGATLARQSSFPSAQRSVPVAPAVQVRALRGVPPKAELLDQPIPGETTSAYLVDGPGGQPPLAVVNISGARAHIEIWELKSAGKPVFARSRPVRLDPEQDSWTSFLLSDVARLPGNRLLLAVFYYAPQVKQALFVYDVAAGSYTKIANVVPYADNRQKFFEAQWVAPDTALVSYYTGRTRIAPEIYYNTPTHLRLFSPRYPQGIELLQLAAADGSVARWSVLDKTLWLESRDTRKPREPKTFAWSLSLENLLPR